MLMRTNPEIFFAARLAFLARLIAADPYTGSSGDEDLARFYEKDRKAEQATSANGSA